NPPVRRILVECQFALLASHGPEVAQSVSGSGGHRMIAVRQEDGITVPDLVRDGFPFIRVYRLVTETLRWIDAIVIDLFQFGLAITPVMFVRREAAPVPRRIERFSNHQ